MKTYSLVHLGDQDLRRLATLVARDCGTTAELLAHIAEVDARQLYRPAAYPSMFAYCVGELGLSEDAAAKRIQVARVAREFPVLFAAIEDGRLHLSAVVLLAPHLRGENVDELVTAASHTSKAEVERMLVERCPKPDVPTRLEPVGTVILGQGAGGALALSVGVASDPGSPAASGLGSAEHAPGHVGMTIPEPGSAPPAQSRLTPLAPGRFALQTTISQATHDKIRYAQALLSQPVPDWEIAELLDQAMDAFIERLEKRKFAATSRARAGAGRADRRKSVNPRHVPAHVKRAVWERDGGRCTFESESGRRGEDRKSVV